MRVLLVEDDYQMPETAAAYLRRVGFAVDVAGDGRPFAVPQGSRAQRPG